MTSQDTTVNASHQDVTISGIEARQVWTTPEVRVLRIPSDTLGSTASGSDGGQASSV